MHFDTCNTESMIAKKVLILTEELYKKYTLKIEKERKKLTIGTSDTQACREITLRITLSLRSRCNLAAIQ